MNAYAEIAYKNLTEETKSEVDELINVIHSVYPQCDTFCNASTWADEVRLQEGLRIFDSWHFTNIPYDPESVLSANDLNLIHLQNRNNDVQWFITKAIEVLSQNNATPFTKAFSLVLFIHTIADIHQPFHCCTYYSKEFPQGDRGGNLYLIDGVQTKNLHQYWDSCVGLFSVHEDQDRIATMSDYLIGRFPIEYFGDSSDFDYTKIHDWCVESRNIAVNHGYKIKAGSVPDALYIMNNQQIALERIVLSGYRLANILNAIFTKQTDS